MADAREDNSGLLRVGGPVPPLLRSPSDPPLWWCWYPDRTRRPGKEVVETLERLGVPFTGARSHFYEPSKETMKMVAIYHGIKTANYVVCLTAEDATAAAEKLKFPVIVKHCSGYSSIGMTKASKCLDAPALQSEVHRMVEEFGGALVEEFIAGREFTVLVSDCPTTDAQGQPTGPGSPVAYQPVECLFPEVSVFSGFQ